MLYLRTLVLLCCFMCIANVAFSQPKGMPKSNATVFKGTLKQKPWSKSAQSYCAQGSEYYVLVQANGDEIVIQDDTKVDLDNFIDKEVTIKGWKETKTIKPSSNPMEQRPVTTDPFGNKPKDEAFTCTVLVLQSIK